MDKTSFASTRTLSVLGSKGGTRHDSLGCIPGVSEGILLQNAQNNKDLGLTIRKGHLLAHRILLIIAEDDMVLPGPFPRGEVEIMLVQSCKEPRVRRRLILLRPRPLPALHSH